MNESDLLKQVRQAFERFRLAAPTVEERATRILPCNYEEIASLQELSTLLFPDGKPTLTPDQYPLEYEMQAGRLVISVGSDMLAIAASQENRDTATSGILISDTLQFGKDVLAELRREKEDGSTLITDVLDEACKRAYEQGSLGIDYEGTATVRCNCGHLFSAHELTEKKSYCHHCDGSKCGAQA